MAGGQPQPGVRGDSERAGGEILHPVCLAGGNGGRSGGYQPPRLVLGVRAEFGRTFHGHRGGGRAAAALRLGRRGLEQRRHLLVGMQCRGGQVPGSPVWLVMQGLGELAVRRGALRERRRVVDGGPDEGMGEMQARPVYLDQAQLLGRGEGLRIWPAAPPGGRAQVRAVGHGGEQQCGSRLARAGRRTWS